MKLKVNEVRPFDNTADGGLKGVVLKMSAEGRKDAFGEIRGNTFYALRENTTLAVGAELTIKDEDYDIVPRQWVSDDGEEMTLNYLVGK